MKINLTNLFSALFLSLLFIFSVSAQTEDNSGKNENKGNNKQADRPFKILKKSFPRTDGRCGRDEGIIRLKVTFHSSAKVTDVEVISPSPCEYFNREAVQAAAKINFQPEIKDGEPQTMVKAMEYKYRSF